MNEVEWKYRCPHCDSDEYYIVSSWDSLSRTLYECLMCNRTETFDYCWFLEEQNNEAATAVESKVDRCETHLL